jgi:hypothetical protein
VNAKMMFRTLEQWGGFKSSKWTAIADLIEHLLTPGSAVPEYSEVGVLVVPRLRKQRSRKTSGGTAHPSQ